MDMMDMKSLIKKNIIDFSELVLNNFYKLGLDETEAIILIKLHYLLNRNINYISPKQLSTMLSISPQTTSKRLNSLIDRGFIRIELVPMEDGKQTESFNIDYLVERIVKSDYEEKKEDIIEQNKSIESKLVKLFQEEFKKQLSVLDIQTITKWLNEDKYTYDKIEDSLFEAVRTRKLSIKYVDAILLNNPTKPIVQTQRKTANIKELKKIWEE